jgi:Fur family ferric uptake transcriptional regulator
MTKKFMEDNRKVWRKITTQRTEILEFLQQSREHPNANKVYLEIKKKLPRISLSTIYRTLDELEKQNLVRVLNLSAREKRYETNFSDHIDFYCTSCRRVFDVPLVEIMDIKRRMESHGYQTNENEFILKGLCPTCLKYKK